MKNTMLFDLGNTLVYYFEKQEFPEILRQAIAEVQNYLSQKSLLCMSPNEIWHRVEKEDCEASDHSVRPLEERLVRIFKLDLTSSGNIVMDMCHCFMKPIFERARYYEDTLPALSELRAKGFRTAIVSNTTWGSPASLWREEIKRLGLNEYLDDAIFCRDVGWRKPAKQIFEYTLKQLRALPEQCLFVGDDQRWDLVGPNNAGIEAIIINRQETAHVKEAIRTIRSLGELIDKLESL